jgi:hypothetical protein
MEPHKRLAAHVPHSGARFRHKITGELFYVDVATTRTIDLESSIDQRSVLVSSSQLVADYQAETIRITD